MHVITTVKWSMILYNLVPRPPPGFFEFMKRLLLLYLRKAGSLGTRLAELPCLQSTDLGPEHAVVDIEECGKRRSHCLKGPMYKGKLPV